MLIVDSHALRDAVDAGEFPLPLAVDAADCTVTTPYGSYALASTVLSRVSEFFHLSMSDRWNEGSPSASPAASPPASPPEDAIRFRYWLPLDSYLVDRNPVVYSCPLSRETLQNAATVDNLFRAIYGLPLRSLDLDSCNRLIEAADAYNCLADTNITATVSAFWAGSATLGAAIRTDPWQFLLASFQTKHRGVFDTALAYCVGLWHALPAIERQLLTQPKVGDCDVGDEVFEMRYLPDILQRFVLDTYERLSVTQCKADGVLRNVATEPELDGLAKLDMMLSGGETGWESQTAHAARLAREVIRAFVADNLALAKTAPRTAYACLHRGLQVKDDGFFATVDFEMVRHHDALVAVSERYWIALSEMARQYKDPELLLQIHRLHNAMKEFQASIKPLVRGLCDDRRSDEGTEVLLCTKVRDGKYPWRVENDWRSEKKRTHGEGEEGRKARKCENIDVGFVRGHGACG